MKAWVLVASLGTVLLGAGVACADEPQWIREDEAAALKAAAESGKLVLVDIWADWCPWCTRLDEKVFSTPEFAEAAKDFVLLKIDSDANEGYLDKTGQRGLPTTAFLSPDGKVYFATAGYMWVPAYTGMMKLVNETWKAGGDTAELPAKIENLDKANPDPGLDAAAAAEELLRRTGLDYAKGPAGSFTVTVSGVELSVAAMPTATTTLLSVSHSWPKPEGDPAALAASILSSNANAGVGSFGVSQSGEVTLHEQVVADGLNADTTKALLDAVAAVANAYKSGETLAKADLGTGDVASIKALLTEAGLAATDTPGGVAVKVGDAEVTVTVGTNVLSLYATTDLKTTDEKIAPLVPMLAQVSAIIGSGRICAGEDGTLGLAFGAPSAGLDSSALKYYLDTLSGLRTSVLRWVTQQTAQKQ